MFETSKLQDKSYKLRIVLFDGIIADMRTMSGKQFNLVDF